MPDSTTASRNDLSRALRQLDLLEDYCDMFDRLVDMSDISTSTTRTPAPSPGCQTPSWPRLGRFSIPATSMAYINETEFRWIRARSRAFSPSIPTPPARSETAWPIPSAAGIRIASPRAIVGWDKLASSDARPTKIDRKTEKMVGRALRSLVPSYRLPRGHRRVLPRQPMVASGKRKRSAASIATASGSCDSSRY